jgi:hypothetical protein
MHACGFKSACIHLLYGMNDDSGKWSEITGFKIVAN